MSQFAFAPYNTHKTFEVAVPVEVLEKIRKYLDDHYSAEGFTVESTISDDGNQLTLWATKSDLFRTIAGLTAAIKIDVFHDASEVHVVAGIGANGQHLIPTLVGAVLFWPIAVTGGWGMIKQLKMDDKAVDMVAHVLGVYDPNCPFDSSKEGQ